MEKKYWKSLEEQANLPIINPGQKDVDASRSLLDLIDDEIDSKPSSRRNFLKFCGFSFATAAIATSCQNPVQTAIPYLSKPEEVTPGMANHYASTYFDGQDYNGILVKVRDGRPIKIEGNELSSVSQGATSARVQGSVLSLYDDGARFKSPMIAGKESTWNAVDIEVISKLTAASLTGKSIALVTSTIISPSTLSVIEEFKTKFPTTKHITYDAVSSSALLQANNLTFGTQTIPDYYFDKADVIVSFEADFLGTWLMPVEFTRRFAASRRLNAEKRSLSQLTVFESGMSLTGSNADYRFPIKPSQQASVILSLYNEIAKATGGTTYSAPASAVDVTKLAQKLIGAKGNSIVVCGINDTSIQIVVNAINQMLQNYGSTIDFSASLNIRKGIDEDMTALVKEMNEGKTNAVIFYNVNPVYNYSEPKLLLDGLKKVELTVSLSNAIDETAAVCSVVAPDHHFLESWNDAEPKKGLFSLQQPTINHIYWTRQAQESLLKWAGSTTLFSAYLKQYWQQNFIGKQSEYTSAADFWNYTLQKGVFELPATSAQPAYTAQAVADAATKAAAVKSAENELVFYETIALGNGQHTNNPWMMEMPDPISKVCWDNFAAISPSEAKKLGVVTGDVLKLAEGLELVAYIQPGQAEGTIAIAYGYGRTKAGKVADGVGVNVFPFMKMDGGNRKSFMATSAVTKTGKKYNIASTQMYHSMEGRDIVRETTLAEWKEKPNSGNEMHEETEKLNVTLYKEILYEGHHWGMSIDLNACTGCSACVIGCQAENNVPVVGKAQVELTRIMHWIRIDRYYSADEANPSVYFQPVMCQQCDNAPCENVCPVSATNHSSEGLNQMAYNRCIGTKYCINNCPYKVRRFNWFRYATNDAFDYNMNSDMGRMVLNPDVTVRERGVVEKCSFCVQRIQEKKLQAKLENRELADGDIKTACMQVCPAGAIIFGDTNNKQGKLIDLFTDQRNYNLIEEIHTLPSVGYLTKVRNREEETGKA
ncbi:MAG: Fe-S-cluster-containing hydrogenase [Bacteroidales bacterium]|nr:Fe-S-cluster-containing hydrogenase [Bacteroidales bacterium]